MSDCQGPEFCIDDICASSDVGMCGIPHPHTIGERCSSTHCYECLDDDEYPTEPEGANT